jgi:antitoxin PrlF
VSDHSRRGPHGDDERPAAGLECAPRGTRPVGAIRRVTARGRTTIPREIREALGIAPGDSIVWEVPPGGTAVVRRVQPRDEAYFRAVEGTLSEWTSPADEEAFRGL